MVKSTRNVRDDSINIMIQSRTSQPIDIPECPYKDCCHQALHGTGFVAWLLLPSDPVNSKFGPLLCALSPQISSPVLLSILLWKSFKSPFISCHNRPINPVQESQESQLFVIKFSARFQISDFKLAIRLLQPFISGSCNNPPALLYFAEQKLWRCNYLISDVATSLPAMRFNQIFFFQAHSIAASSPNPSEKDQISHNSNKYEFTSISISFKPILIDLIE